MARILLKLSVLVLLLVGSTEAWAVPPPEERKATEAEPRVDSQGDPLPPGATARLGTVRLRKGFITYQAIFSPDGRRMATAGAGHGVCVWDAATGKEVFHASKASASRTVAYAPDGKTLACACYSSKGLEAALLNADSGEPVRLLGPANPLAFTFSPDGTRLAMSGYSGGNPALVIWEASTGKLLHRWPLPKVLAGSLSFSRDGKLLAGTNQLDDTDSRVHLWDATTGETLTPLSGHRKGLLAVAFSRSGRILASAGEDETIRLWDVGAKAVLRTLTPQLGAVRSVAFAPDDSILAAGHDDGTIQLWDAGSGRALRRWKGHAGLVQSLAFAPDGKTLLSASLWESALRLWDTATGAEIRPSPGHRGLVDWVAFAPEGNQLFSTGRDKRLLAWELSTGQARPVFEWTTARFSRTAVAADRKTLATISNGDGALQLWDVVGGGPVRILAKYTDGQGGADLCFAPDSTLLACACQDKVELWDVATGKALRRFSVNPRGGHIAFSPDGKVLACGEMAARPVDDSILHFWDVTDGKELRRIETEHLPGPLGFSPDGRLLAVSGSWRGGQLQVWDLAKGQPLPIAPTHGMAALAFSADGRFLAVAGMERSRGVSVLEVFRGKQACRFEAPQEMTSVAFAPAGTALATGCADGSILVWDLATRAVQARSAGRAQVQSTREFLAAWKPRPPFRYPEARHGKGELKYLHGLPVLTLAGTPEEMGEQMGILALRPALAELNIDHFVEEHFQGIIAQQSLAWLKAMAHLLGTRFPKEHRAELEAMAKAAGLDRDLLMLGNLVPDLGLLGCSTLLVDPARSGTGKPLFGRNMDYPPRAGIERLSLVVVWHPQGKPAFAGVGYPGMLVSASTINSAGLAWTVNSISSAADDSARFNPFGTPMAVWLRRLAEEGTDVASAEKLIRPVSRTGMLSLSICDKNGGAVFEITSKSLVVRHGIQGVCACTNHFLSKELTTNAGCWRYPQLEASQKLAKLGLADIAQKLHEVNQGRWTLQTMIFEPADLKLHLAIGRGPASARPLQEIDLAPLLTTPPANANANREGR